SGRSSSYVSAVRILRLDGLVSIIPEDEEPPSRVTEVSQRGPRRRHEQRRTDDKRRKGVRMRVFVAGAGGAIGRRLLPQLVAHGHEGTATTRNADKMADLCALGAEPLVMDGLDADSVGEAVARAEPEVIVHQMTALAGIQDLKHFDDTFAVTNQLRTNGTDHLLAAGDALGVRRFIAASYTGWPSARTGGPIKTE